MTRASTAGPRVATLSVCSPRTSNVDASEDRVCCIVCRSSSIRLAVWSPTADTGSPAVAAVPACEVDGPAPAVDAVSIFRRGGAVFVREVDCIGVVGRSGVMGGVGGFGPGVPFYTAGRYTVSALQACSGTLHPHVPQLPFPERERLACYERCCFSWGPLRRYRGESEALEGDMTNQRAIAPVLYRDGLGRGDRASPTSTPPHTLRLHTGVSRACAAVARSGPSEGCSTTCWPCVGRRTCRPA